ncbi:unnamed protein product [Owenia fusiformis]|uniref:Uncharacterized protein n=1 Tax=Owenia fusiformis TaxID=6347 RepID=A0A8S4Q738_OWEFU|nr:unnamed protein product [Owenia fusiformis]
MEYIPCFVYGSVCDFYRNTMWCHVLAPMVMLSVCNAFVKYPDITAIEVVDAAQCDGGYFEYEDNKCRYYQCQPTDQFDSGFEAYPRWCMKPLNFDPETCSCQWPNSVEDGDYLCHEEEVEEEHLRPDEALIDCDVRGMFDQCCQPCTSYNQEMEINAPDNCATGKGPPYTMWENETGYTYCGEEHACPEGEKFEIGRCRCTSTIWFVDCYYFPFWPNGTPLEDETNSGIMGPGDCTVRPNDRNGLECDGIGDPATLDMMQKQWLGRGWAIGFGLDNAGDGVLISNGNENVPASIEVSKQDQNVIVKLSGDQGDVEVSVPYLSGSQRYLIHMSQKGIITLINQDMDEDTANPPYTWALEGTRLPLQFGQSAGFFTDVLVCYFPPTGQGAVDWVFGGPPPSPPTIADV